MTKQVGLRMPADLVDRIDAIADAEHRSRSNAIVVLLERALAEQKAGAA